MREVSLPSGATLRVGPSPFGDALRLNEATLRVLRGVDVKPEDMGNVIKGLLCDVASSPEFKAALQPCLARCLYNGGKIDEKTFEDSKTWGDYYDVVYEVAKENLEPFMKSLYARLLALVGASAKSQS